MDLDKLEKDLERLWQQLPQGTDRRTLSRILDEYFPTTWERI